MHSNNKILKWTLFSFGIIVLLATLLSRVRAEYWWVRLCDFPRMQIIPIAFLTGVFYYLLFGAKKRYEKIFLFCIAACIIYQGIRMYPYTILSPIQVHQSSKTNNEANQISILISNVLMTNTSYEKCLAEIHKYEPDIILTLETDTIWRNRLKSLEAQYPFRLQAPLSNTYGMLLYSKLKLIDPQIKYLLDKEIPSMHSLIELRSGKRIMFHGVHPKPPAPQESKTSIKRDAELIMVGKECKNSPYPIIVAGDLNDVAWSHTTHLFQRNSSLLDPRIGRGMYSTFNAKYYLLRWPLDHVFHSTDFKLVEMERAEHIDSDHFPMYIKLSYEPEAKAEQKAPQPDHEDKKEGDEKIEEAKGK